MNKLLILLLFVLVQNMEKDGLTVYDVEQLMKIDIYTYQLKVKIGEEFYIKLPPVTKSVSSYQLENYDKFPDALQVYGSEGKPFLSEDNGISYGSFSFGFVTHFYKFKALKTSTNQITLKFFNRKLLNSIYVAINITS